MYVVIPRYAAAAVVSAVVAAPAKEYAHPYSMMHRRLTTAGIEVAPPYHQLLVYGGTRQECLRVIYWIATGDDSRCIHLSQVRAHSYIYLTIWSCLQLQEAQQRALTCISHC